MVFAQYFFILDLQTTRAAKVKSVNEESRGKYLTKGHLCLPKNKFDICKL